MQRIHPRPTRRLLARLVLVVPAVAAALAAGVASAAKPAASGKAGADVQVHQLSNGMTLVLIPRHLTPTVAGGWVARVGSANERPGITGMSHLFEHMMFKGTHVIGTQDYAKDAALIEEQEKVRDEMRAEITKLREKQRRGEIDDITSPEARTDRYKELEKRFDQLVEQQRANMVKNEFNKVLQKNGGTFINAFTNHDMTVYFETVPANKLELWFWLESDRLKNRVFREFYSERDVVYEERRMRTESTPTGKFQESFESLFWESSPYSWPVVGWPSDIASITLDQANAYYEQFYAPQNLTAVLVGDFDPAKAREMAERYLGSIPRGVDAAPEMITAEVHQLAEKRFYAEGEMNPSVTIRWHGVPFVHKDAAALEVISGALNGPTGRIQRNVVLGAQVAASGNSQQETRKYSGFFEISAEAKEDHTPEEVEQALHAEIEKLKKTPLGADELQSVKNRYLATSYRTLTSNFQIMLRYLVGEGFGDLRGFERMERDVQAVTAEDVTAALNKYFTKENRAVAIWTRAQGAEREDPAIASLPPQAKAMVKQALTQIEKAEDPALLQEMLARMAQLEAQVPPEMKPAIDYVKSKAEERLSALSAADGGAPR
jgi:predicted Zn-dependent peptidase